MVDFFGKMKVSPLRVPVLSSGLLKGQARCQHHTTRHLQWGFALLYDTKLGNFG
jgi:hypothetical protein